MSTIQLYSCIWLARLESSNASNHCNQKMIMHSLSHVTKYYIKFMAIFTYINFCTVAAIVVWRYIQQVFSKACSPKTQFLTWCNLHKEISLLQLCNYHYCPFPCNDDKYKVWNKELLNTYTVQVYNWLKDMVVIT